MIVEFFVNVGFGIVMGFLDLLEAADIKTGILFDLACVLSEFGIYGCYVVGADLLFIFSGLVISWTMAKLSVGLGIKLWELLPLT